MNRATWQDPPSLLGQLNVLVGSRYSFDGKRGSILQLRIVLWED